MNNKEIEKELFQAVNKVSDNLFVDIYFKSLGIESDLLREIQKLLITDTYLDSVFEFDFVF